MHHVGLLPEQLAHQVGDLGLPVVTWEQVFAEYSDVAPPYWLDVLDHALSQYDALVSKYSGPNMEFQIDGTSLWTGSEQEDIMRLGWDARADCWPP